METPAHYETKQRPLGRVYKTKDGLEVSLYGDDILKKIDTSRVDFNVLHHAFGEKSGDFWTLMATRILANNFTEERLKDAIHNAIDTCRTLTIADIIQYDKRVKLYTGRDFLEAQLNGRDQSEFERRNIGGIEYFILKSDLV